MMSESLFCASCLQKQHFFRGLPVRVLVSSSSLEAVSRSSFSSFVWCYQERLKESEKERDKGFKGDAFKEATCPKLLQRHHTAVCGLLRLFTTNHLVYIFPIPSIRAGHRRASSSLILGHTGNCCCCSAFRRFTHLPIFLAFSIYLLFCYVNIVHQTVIFQFPSFTFCYSE